MTAIRASFSDFRIVKGRKVAQLVMEVPIEEANNALAALGGVPQPDSSFWVGIAPITKEAASRPTEKPKRRMSEMSRAQQAGILCSDPQFQQWLERTGKITITVYEDPAILAAEFVRTHCGVTSRASLDSQPEGAGAEFDALRTEYDAWRGKIAKP